jgi:hypothetical protein
MYVNYFDRHEKQDDETPTVGIILCKDKSKALVEMTLPKDNEQIFVLSCKRSNKPLLNCLFSSRSVQLFSLASIS